MFIMSYLLFIAGLSRPLYFSPVHFIRKALTQSKPLLNIYTN